MRDHPERIVAVVNGLLVMLLPFALMLAVSDLRIDSNTSVTVRAPGASRMPHVLALIEIAKVLFPFAALAAWRSLVYARRWRDESDRGWRAVAESGACGLAVMIVILAPGIVTRPLEAPPYLIAYGGAALVVGLLVGLFLRMSAILVLKLLKSAAA